MDKRVAYSIACQAEVESSTVALKLQDELPQIRARSLLGIIAKLEIIAGSDRDIDEPTNFPWGSWKLFELSGSRLSPNCGCLWTK
ncbi:hypothetical protein [Mesorhizobium sp. LNJC391B00]|uniref:hypothetical protein n=1 Tax=Mesorhizobium sp. LNJC391B00 TaxID=1287273 RepID=UPI0003CE5596|nr:hypothetical protein [Mesorhizobium sp. LNJC391B00]ESY18641.1 hypothetical protein X749_30265 [Mesorhizobium sp. LNJC391B00]